MKQPKHAWKTTPAKHPFIFKLITAIIPLAILLLFEGTLRLAGYGDNLDLFVKNPVKGYEKYLMVNPEIGKKYFRKFEYTSPANDIFYAEKPGNTFRVFVMGSSTVYGFPYERNLMFSRILHQMLEDACPGKKIEVVNTAITAINSFTLLDFAGQILKYDPDAVLIYAGHNEFYGAFGIGSNETMSRNATLTRLHIFLMDLRMYQLVRNLISTTAGKLAAGKSRVHGTLMKRMVADNSILYGSGEYRIAMKRYRQNMEKILRKFRSKNVPVFISEVVSNVRDIEPFGSVANDTLEAAADVFRMAKSAEQQGDFESAHNLYYRAKDLDGIRFRASEDVNRVVNDLAAGYGAVRVPMLSWFQKNALNGLIGNNLMTEHVHPNVDGNFLMAGAFFNSLAESGILGQSDVPEIHSLSYYKKNWGYTPLDTLLAFHRVQLLKGFWPFVKAGEPETDHTKTYHPENRLDSLAFSTLINKKVDLAAVRLELAHRYKKTGETEKACREYEALIKTNPYIAENYRDAATCLIELQDLPLALLYLGKSLEYENSFYAHFRMGEILLVKGDFENASASFRDALNLASEEEKPKVLVKLYLSLVYGNMDQEAGKVKNEILKQSGGKNLDVPARQYLYDRYIPYQTRAEVDSAKYLVSAGEAGKALEILLRSLETYDSHIASRIIGEIYLEQKEFAKAEHYLSRVYDEFKFDRRFLQELLIIKKQKNDTDGMQKIIKDLQQNR